MLLKIWSAILRTDRVGIDDDFLALGGDSLAAMRCINRIRTVFDVELPLDLFFADTATVVHIAAELDRVRNETGGSSTGAADDAAVENTLP